MSIETKCDDDSKLDLDYFDMYYSCVFSTKSWKAIAENFLSFLMIMFASLWKLVKPNEKSLPLAPSTHVLVKSEMELFTERENLRFKKMFEADSSDEEWNINMDSAFYNPDEYKSIMINEKNELETKWKTRILFENTPRGNIMMFYDAYKKGFSYYSDQQGIPYAVLNTCAMKYVRIFCCRDLFVDENVTPGGFQSPLIALQKKEDENMKKDNTFSTGIDKEILKKAPFAKLKNYKTDDQKSKGVLKNTGSQRHGITIKEISTNRFIYLGKYINSTFLQTIPKPKKVLKFSQNSFEHIFNGQQKAQESRIDYSTYKKLLLTKPNSE